MGIYDLHLPALDDTACDRATLHILYGLVAYIKPALVVEAGTYRGHAACMMANAMREHGIDGEVWTADVQDYGAREIVERNGLQDYIHLFSGDFTSMLDTMLKGRAIRLAFIDSGPTISAEGVNVPCEATNLRYTHYIAARALGALCVVDDAAGLWDNVEAIRTDASLYLPQRRGLVITR